MEKILDKSEPSEAWLPGGSATFLAIIIAIVLINMVFPLSRNWTVGLSWVLAIAGLVIVPLTINGWLNWRLFRDTAIESSGKVVQRIHEEHKGGYGGTDHEYFFVVQFTNGQGPVKLKARVNETRYAATREGSSVVVRFAPSRPRVARIKWDTDATSFSK